jgi:hypothetical protein
MILASFLFSFAIRADPFFAVQLSAQDSVTAFDHPSAVATRQEVWQAVLAELRSRGFLPEQLPGIEEVDLPGGLPDVAGRKLRVSSACWEQISQRTQFRLACGSPGQCLPFFVYVHDLNRKDVQGQDVHGQDRERSPTDPGARFGSCRQKTETPAAAEAPLKPLLNSTVKAGDRATAVFVSASLRITASVTCLDRGRQGEVIRVRNQDGEVFRARISSPGLLEVLPQ